jgi:predicted nucleotidyltransferase
MTMKIDKLQNARIADICRRYGVRRMQMFGSATQEAENSSSDVDLLIEFNPGQFPTGFALVDMQDELSALFDGRAVDLAFSSVLSNPFRRKAIEPQLKVLFQ